MREIVRQIVREIVREIVRQIVRQVYRIYIHSDVVIIFIGINEGFNRICFLSLHLLCVTAVEVMHNLWLWNYV